MERIMVYNLVGSFTLSDNEGEILHAEIEKDVSRRWLCDGWF